MEWLRDVLEELSQVVASRDGVLLENTGDSLTAMWGAPVNQPNQADLACHAAAEMLDQLNQVNQRWSSAVATPLECLSLRIGIHTGKTVVGQKGSDFRYRWGPIGETVQLACGGLAEALLQFSPSESSAFRMPVIVLTDNVLERLTEPWQTRLLGDFRVRPGEQSQAIHELAAEPSQAWSQLKEYYDLARRQFEKCQYQEALDTLDHLAEVPNLEPDGPALRLRDRIQTAMARPHVSGENGST